MCTQPTDCRKSSTQNSKKEGHESRGRWEGGRVCERGCDTFSKSKERAAATQAKRPRGRTQRKRTGIKSTPVRGERVYPNEGGSEEGHGRRAERKEQEETRSVTSGPAGPGRAGRGGKAQPPSEGGSHVPAAQPRGESGKRRERGAGADGRIALAANRSAGPSREKEEWRRWGRLLIPASRRGWSPRCARIPGNRRHSPEVSLSLGVAECFYTLSLSRGVADQGDEFTAYEVVKPHTTGLYLEEF